MLSDRGKWYTVKVYSQGGNSISEKAGFLKEKNFHSMRKTKKAFSARWVFDMGTWYN